MSTQTVEHFTAWITTDTSCLAGDHADVMVLADEIVGYREEDNVEVPEWGSRGSAKFTAVTSINAMDGDHADIMREAEQLLADAGWQALKSSGATWEAVPTGYIATVEHA